MELYHDQSLLWYPIFPLRPSTHDGPAAQKHFQSSPIVSTHDGLTYDRVNFSTFQATVARGAHGQVVANYWQYKYNDNLSEELLVIEDTSIMTTWVKGYQLSTIQVQW